MHQSIHPWPLTRGTRERDAAQRVLMAFIPPGWNGMTVKHKEQVCPDEYDDLLPVGPAGDWKSSKRRVCMRLSAGRWLGMHGLQMLTKLRTILDSVSNPLHDELVRQRRAFSERLLPPKCMTVTPQEIMSACVCVITFYSFYSFYFLLHSYLLYFNVLTSSLIYFVLFSPPCLQGATVMK